MKRLFTLFGFILIFSSIYGQNSWVFVEETYIKGSISGTITKGYIFKTQSRDYYVVNERNRQRVRTRNPAVKILMNGSDYKLIIEDFDEPIICKKIKNVIETQIDGEFAGWEGETIFKMMNGQLWQQSSYDYTYQYAYCPEVLIYKYNNSWIMKVEDVDETIEVIQINTNPKSAKTTSVIETQIDGEFEGWEGETIFKLMNGQIWQQSSYAYFYHYAYCPNVIIYKTSNGFIMKVEGIDKKISVIQLR
ncbi:MAG: hypothetical protein MUP85_23025 [Candidatus Lokiarchaeota archaeon]|nr:hypothetical protein [Candidatus Lokiarchaeota archaeon]